MKGIVKSVALLFPPLKRLKERLDSTKGRNIVLNYLQGQGIEIGALHSPFPVSSNMSVKYVDRLTRTELTQQYPELDQYNLIEPDIIDDGETLSSITEESQDFVIACHMIEHCQNPIGTIENFLRVTKPGGVVFLAAPDKRYCFDRDRPVTSISHLIKDYEQGPNWSKYSHFKEWVEFVGKKTGEEANRAIEHLIEIDYSIHFHVWTSSDFQNFLLYCQKKLNFPFEVEFFQKNGDEFLVILRKLKSY